MLTITQLGRAMQNSLYLEDPPHLDEQSDVQALNEFCAQFLKIEAEAWHKAFADLGVKFDTSAFITEAAGKMDAVLRDALIYGAGLTLRDITRLRLKAARSKAVLVLRTELLEQGKLPEQISHLKVLKA